MKKLCLLITLFLVVEQTYCQAIRDGLQAYYSFENGSVNDLSGNGYGGSIVGADIVADRNGENSALKFNGNNDFVVTSTAIDENLSTGASFSAWIYISEIGSTMRIISNYNGTGRAGDCRGRIGFVFGVTRDQRLNIFYATNGDDYIGRQTSAGVLEGNKWYHVVGTWDGRLSSSGFKIYLDGEQRDIVNMQSGRVCNDYLESTNPFHIGIGHCSRSACAPFNGSIDDVSIYDRALSESEINLIMNDGVTDSPAVGLWTLKDQDIYYSDGKVGIGTSEPDDLLTVNGVIHAKEVKVDLSVPAPDYVFKSDYELKSLDEVEEYIRKYSHLPEVPSAAQMEQEGVNVGEMNMLLLKKIEELTLYQLQQNREMEELKALVNSLLPKDQLQSSE